MLINFLLVTLHNVEKLKFSICFAQENMKTPPQKRKVEDIFSTAQAAQNQKRRMFHSTWNV
jgi:hypothetical protein